MMQLLELRAIVVDDKDTIASPVKGSAPVPDALLTRVHLRHRAGRDVEDEDAALVDGDVVHDQQAGVVRRPVHDRPEALALHHLAMGSVVRTLVSDINVVVTSITASAGIDETVAAVGPIRSRMPGPPPIGQQTAFAACEVEPIQLEEFIATDIPQLDEPVLGGVGRDRSISSRLAEESELAAGAHGLADPVNLVGVAESSADQDAAIVQPPREASAPGVLVLI